MAIVQYDLKDANGEMIAQSMSFNGKISRGKIITTHDNVMYKVLKLTWDMFDRNVAIVEKVEDFSDMIKVKIINTKDGNIPFDGYMEGSENTVEIKARNKVRNMRLVDSDGKVEIVKGNPDDYTFLIGEKDWVVLGFYKHKDDKEINSLTAMVVIETGHRKLTCYTGAEAHNEISREYFAECVAITKEQYLIANNGLFTPADYLK